MEQELCTKKQLTRTPRIVSRTYRSKFAWIRMEGPDGGWAWAVAFSACIISFIMAGLGRMTGILFVVFIDWFQVDRQAASTPFSIRSTVRNLLGPVVGILGQKYGVRAVTISGGIMATLSAAACFFVPDIIWMTVLWGALNGVGAALTVTLPQVIVGQYFVKYTTTATGMAFSGGCIGSFLFPVLLEQLLLEYGMQGTFLILGAIIMHTIPAAMILKKPPWLRNGGNRMKGDMKSVDSLNESSDLKEELLSAKENDRNHLENNTDVHSNRNSNGKDRSASKAYADIQFLRKHNDVVVKIFAMETPMDCYLSLPMEINQNEPFPSREACISKEIEDLYCRVQNFQRKLKFHHVLKTFKTKRCNDELYNGGAKSISNQKSQSFVFPLTSEFDLCDVYKTCSVPDVSRESKKVSPNYVGLKLKDLRNCHSAVSSRFPEEEKGIVMEILTELGKLYDANAALDDSAKDGSGLESGDFTGKNVQSSSNFAAINRSVPSNTLWSHMGTAVQLHRKPIFLLICFCRSVHFITFVPAMTIIVDFLMDKGFKEEDGKYAIAVLSLGDLLGRLCFGWVTDKGYLALARYMLVVMVLQGASTATLPLMYTKTTLYLALAGFGLLQGSLFVRHNVLVTKYMNDNEQSIAMGCMNFFSGILGFGIPAYIGYFRDTLGTYNYIFYINGAVNFLIGTLWAFEPYLVPRSSPKVTVDEESPTPV